MLFLQKKRKMFARKHPILADYRLHHHRLTTALGQKERGVRSDNLCMASRNYVCLTYYALAVHEAEVPQRRGGKLLNC